MNTELTLSFDNVVKATQDLYDDWGCLWTIVALLGVVVFAIALYAGIVLLLMEAWSLSLVPIFHLPAITFWQCVGFTIIYAFVKGCVRSLVKKA